MSRGLMVPTLSLKPLRQQIYMASEVQASYQTIVGDLPVLIYSSIKDNVMSQGWFASHKSIINTYSSVNNMYKINFGSHSLQVPMATDFLYYLSKA